MGIIQIDSVNVVARSQELALFARLGAHPRTLIADATARGTLYEYWVHEASFAPSEHHHLHRWRTRHPHPWAGMRAFAQRQPALLDEIEARIRADGPLSASQLAPRTTASGGWWEWNDAKAALEALFWAGRVAARRRWSDFARLYDAPERVIDPTILARPTPPEGEARKQLLLLAARAHGVATAADLADYHRQKLTAVRPLIAELVEAGELVPVEVEHWREPAYLRTGASRRRADTAPIAARALLSPFDPVVWNRARAERLFGFTYRIEIYTPAHRRIHGYYVMPFLLGDRLVGRVDLKADRQQRRLLVRAAWGEAGIERTRVADALADELATMATWLDLDAVVVERRGDLATALARAVKRARTSR